MAEYYYVSGLNGVLDRKLIPEADIKLNGDLMEFFPAGMLGVSRILVYCSKFSDNGITDNIFWERLENMYRQWGQFGRFKDWLFLRYETTRFMTNCFELVLIAREDWQKPVQAADVLPFFKNENNEIFFLGIMKKYKQSDERYMALIGGIRNTNGFKHENALEAAIREAKEEASINFMPYDTFDIGKTPLATYAVGNLSDRYKRIISTGVTMQMCGMYWTGDSEIILSIGTKRVHETTAYTFLVDLPKDQDEICDLFQAGDDAVGLFVWKANNGEVPGFASMNHKKMYREALLFHGIV